MKNYEHFLSNYDFIITLFDIGYSIKEMVDEVNDKLNANFTYRELLYLIKLIKTKAIHKEYNDIIIIDSITAKMDANLEKYCVDFHGLLLTFKSATQFTNQEYIITPDNILTIYAKESLLYAKRILKLYHTSDTILLRQHKLNYPHLPEINLDELVHKINSTLEDDFSSMLASLRKKYIAFANGDLKELINIEEGA